MLIKSQKSNHGFQKKYLILSMYACLSFSIVCNILPLNIDIYFPSVFKVTRVSKKLRHISDNPLEIFLKKCNWNLVAIHEISITLCCYKQRNKTDTIGLSLCWWLKAWKRKNII